MIPEGWQLAKIEDLADTFSGGTPSRERVEYYGGPIRWVKSGEVNAGRIRATEETITVLGLQNSSTKVAPAGSVLVAMYGATAGKVALLEIEAAINQAILAIMGHGDSASNEYLAHALNLLGPELLRRVQGSGQPNLSGSLIRSLEIPLPPPPRTTQNRRHPQLRGRSHREHAGRDRAASSGEEGHDGRAAHPRDSGAAQQV